MRKADGRREQRLSRLVKLLMVEEGPRASKEEGAQGSSSSLLTAGRGSRHNRLLPAGLVVPDEKVTNFDHQLKKVARIAKLSKLSKEGFN